jgi:hypothetical protein
VGLAIKNDIPQSELIDRETVAETTSCNFLCGGVIRPQKTKIQPYDEVESINFGSSHPCRFCCNVQIT